MTKTHQQEDTALREALHDLAAQGVPSAEVQAAVRHKLRHTPPAPPRTRPRALRWAGAVALAGVVLIGITLLSALLSRSSGASRISLDITPTVSAAQMPMIVQNSSEIGSYVLSTTLPAAQSSVPTFQQIALPLPTLEEARRLAAQFGMQGDIFTQTYRSENMIGDVVLPAFLIIDGPRRLSVDPDFIRYDDTQVHMPSWQNQQGGNQPAILLDQQHQAALRFLQTMGFDGAHVSQPDPIGRNQMLMFSAVLSGTPAATIHTDIGIGMSVGMSGTEITVGSAWMPRMLFAATGHTDHIVDALTAYSRLVTGTHILASSGGSSATRYNPVWTPQLRAGQWAAIEGMPMVLTPLADAGNPVPQMRVEIRGTRLDLSAIMPAPTLSEPVWAAGTVRAEASGELVLHVERWERGGMPVGTGLTGTVEISGTVDGAPFALLRRPNGEAYFLANAPDDLPNGIVVGGFLRPTERRVNGFALAAWESLEQQVVPPSSVLDVAAQPAPAMTPLPEPTRAPDAASIFVTTTMVQGDAPVEAATGPAGASNAPVAAVAVQNRVWPQNNASEMVMPPIQPDGSVEALEGWLQASLVQDEQGNLKRVEAFLSSAPLTGTRWAAVLSGPLDVLRDLAQRDGTRVRVWGKALSAQPGNTAHIEVSRFERVDPTEMVQVWLGTVTTATLENQTVWIFHTSDGERYVLADSLQYSGVTIPASNANAPDTRIIMEGVLRPERWAGLRIMQNFGWSVSKDNEAALKLYRPTRPQIVQEVASSEVGFVLRAELVYFVSVSSRRVLADGTLSVPDAASLRVTPAWRFSGITSNGRTFVTFIDARTTPAQ